MVSKGTSARDSGSILLSEVAATGSRICHVKPIPRRVQLGIVAAAYVGVVLVAAALLYARHMQYLNHPAEVIAASGMYAAGDWILELFIGGLFLVPTFLLLLLIRNSEKAYTRYSQILLGLSLTAPICLGLFLIPALNQGNSFLGWFCVDRLFASPIVIVALAVSRLLARFGRAKRLTSYALLIEVGTPALLLMLLLLSGSARHG